MVIDHKKSILKITWVGTVRLCKLSWIYLKDQRFLCYGRREVIDRWIHDVHTFGTADKILASWQEQSYTNLLINKVGADYSREYETWDTNDDWALLDNLLSELTKISEFGGSYTIYKLNSP